MYLMEGLDVERQDQQANKRENLLARADFQLMGGDDLVLQSK